MNDELWAFNWRFWIVIVLLVAIGSCFGCAAVPPPRPLLLVWDCNGKARMSEVTLYTSDFPPLACPMLAASLGAGVSGVLELSGMALACAIFSREKAWIVLPHNPSAWTVRHEIGHVVGMTHPAALPLAEDWTACEGAP